MDNKKIICLVSVGEEYHKYLIEKIDFLIKSGFYIHLLTDNTNKFENYKKYISIYQYENEIFNYFDKILFFLRVSKKYKTNVFYIDVNKISENIEDIYSKFVDDTLVVFRNMWPQKININSDSLIFFKTYLTKNTISYDSDIIAFQESHIYFPYFKKINDIIKEFEKMKIVFGYQTLLNNKQYYKPNFNKFNIGYGEGIAIYFVLKKFNIQYKTIFGNHKKNKIF